MMKINSKNFTKRASSIVDALYNDCITLINQLRKKIIQKDKNGQIKKDKNGEIETKEFRIISMPGSGIQEQQWKCLAIQAKEAGKAELLQKLKNMLTEAIDYSDKNPGMTTVNFSQLSSAPELLPLIQSLGSK